MSDDVTLPAVIDDGLSALNSITASLGVPRSLLASDAEIGRAWNQLPDLLGEIPTEHRTEHHVRMCVAVSSGLLDAAINYAWNAAVLRLRDRVRAFGLHVVPALTGKDFDEQALINLKDAELLDLCLRLNLIAEDGFFFLDQCRDIRNNFSSAHPAVGALDDREFVVFVSRCTKYALSDVSDPQGVDSQAFIQALKGVRLVPGQRQEWVDRLEATHEAQREMLMGTIHGVYCDPASSEEGRLNALDLSQAFADKLSESMRSLLINQHSDYVTRGDTQRQAASRTFFEKLGIVNLLNKAEQHSMFSNAVKALLSVHQAFENFYNEPPFAKQLLRLSQQVPVPESVREEFVEAVLMCGVGNGYGVSWAAESTYKELVRNFSPREVSRMLKADQRSGTLARRLTGNPTCRRRFKALVGLLDSDTVSSQDQPAYKRWLAASV